MPSRGSGQGSPKKRLQNKVITIRKCLPEALAEGSPLGLQQGTPFGLPKGIPFGLQPLN